MDTAPSFNKGTRSIHHRLAPSSSWQCQLLGSESFAVPIGRGLSSRPVPGGGALHHIWLNFQRFAGVAKMNNNAHLGKSRVRNLLKYRAIGCQRLCGAVMPDGSSLRRRRWRTNLREKFVGGENPDNPVLCIAGIVQEDS